MLENTSESEEDGDYVLSVQMDTNQDGLRIYVGGQALVNKLLFSGLPFGGTKVVVEVYRGPLMYDYSNNPITLVLESACDGDIFKLIQLKPSFLKPCAKVVFHSSQQPFAISPTTYENRCELVIH